MLQIQALQSRHLLPSLSLQPPQPAPSLPRQAASAGTNRHSMRVFREQDKPPMWASTCTHCLICLIALVLQPQLVNDGSQGPVSQPWKPLQWDDTAATEPKPAAAPLETGHVRPSKVVVLEGKGRPRGCAYPFRCTGFFAASIAFVLAEQLGCPWVPSPRANISTPQGSLYGTGCCFVLLPQGVTSLQHIRPPRCAGCLLRSLLTVATIGLSPVSRRQLSGHTSDLLGAIAFSQSLGAVVSASCLRRFSNVSADLITSRNPDSCTAAIPRWWAACPLHSSTYFIGTSQCFGISILSVWPSHGQ